MKQFRTRAIILNRIEYGEADRILTLLTPDNGKVKAIAKGVRRSQSKLAGGLELFSLSDLSFIVGRGEINTLVSSRLIKHFGNIVKDLGRTNLGYGIIKRLDKATEDNPDAGYFYLLEAAFEALDDHSISLELINNWFNMQLLRLAGHTPNLRTDETGQKLLLGERYKFDFDRMCFTADGEGQFAADHIKFLRLGFSLNTPQKLSRVRGSEDYQRYSEPIISAMLNLFVRQ